MLAVEPTRPDAAILLFWWFPGRCKGFSGGLQGDCSPPAMDGFEGRKAGQIGLAARGGTVCFSPMS
jgi:hypothetical protein